MNKIILLPFFGLIFIHLAFAPASKYEEVMKANIQKVYAFQSLEELQQAINMFDRIAQKEKDKWEPHYYSAYGYMMLALKQQEGDKKDKYLDLALEQTKKGLQLAPKEDELVTMEGFVHMIRVTVDPAARGQKYAGLSMQSLSKAVAMDQTNPRALYMLGQMELGTARFFGSDTSAACEKLKKAVELFESEEVKSPLAPTWGENDARKAVQACG